MNTTTEFRILGPVEVLLGGGIHTAILAPRQRALLAALLLEANQVVSVDRLIDQLWADSPPRQARNAVQSLVRRLRRQLQPYGGRTEVLVTHPPGYRLRVGRGQLDLHRFDEHAEQGRAELAAGRPDAARQRLRQALALWRGEPLLDVAGARLQEVEALWLRERRMQVTEYRIEADLMLGRHVDLVPELYALVAAHPLREHLHAQLMLALYRAGRQAEALEVFHGLRRRLADDLAAEPGIPLVQMFRHILSHEPALDLTDAAPTTVPTAAALQLNPVPHQLPPGIGDFTGRTSLLKRLKHLLAETSVGATEHGFGVALYGQPGVGKTTLAIHLSHQIADRFPDGQLFLDMCGLGATAVGASAALAQLLRALGVDATSIPDGVDERAALYRTVIADRRVLVVLDNAAGEAQVRPLLPSTGDSRIVFTSRRPLSALAPVVRAIHVGPLSHAEAVTLLGRIVGRRRLAGQEEDAARIAALCDHLPLAVRICGTRMAGKPHWPLSRLASRLADRRHRLDELAVGDQEVRSSIGLSFDELSDPERLALRLLGDLWCDDFAVWLAAACLDASAAETEDVVERLVDAQLIQPTGRDAVGQQRYRIDDLIQDFLRERAEGDPLDARQATGRALDACAEAAYRATAQLVGADEVLPGAPTHGDAPGTLCCRYASNQGMADAVTWFSAESAVLTSAVQHASRLSFTRQASRIAHASAVFFEVRANRKDWCQTHGTALEAIQLSGQRRGEFPPSGRTP